MTQDEQLDANADAIAKALAAAEQECERRQGALNGHRIAAAARERVRVANLRKYFPHLAP